MISQSPRWAASYSGAGPLIGRSCASTSLFCAGAHRGSPPPSVIQDEIQTLIPESGANTDGRSLFQLVSTPS